jgi:hypothetical protein
MTTSVAVSVWQAALGSRLEFVGAMLSCDFALIAALALFGGATSPVGLCLIEMFIRNLWVPRVACCIFGVALDSRLVAPSATALVYVVGSLALVPAALAGRAFGSIPMRIFTPPAPERLRTVGSFFAAIGIASMLGSLGARAGEDAPSLGVRGALIYLSTFGLIGIIMLTAAAAASNTERPPMSRRLFFALAASFAIGLFNASKQSMLDPLYAWLVAAIAYGFRPKPRHLPAAALFLATFIFVLYPFSHAGRFL